MLRVETTRLQYIYVSVIGQLVGTLVGTLVGFVLIHGI